MTISDATNRLRQTLEEDDRQLREHPFYSDTTKEYLRKTSSKDIHVSVEVLRTILTFLEALR